MSDQGASTTGFGNYVVLRHDFAEPVLINGHTVTHVHSLYAHLDSVQSLSVGQQIGIGQQIGTLGSSGYSDVAHLHLEITLGDTLPTVDDGYNPAGAPSNWVDPVAFVSSWPRDPAIGEIITIHSTADLPAGIDATEIVDFDLSQLFGYWDAGGSSGVHIGAGEVLTSAHGFFEPDGSNPDGTLSSFAIDATFGRNIVDAIPTTVSLQSDDPEVKNIGGYFNEPVGGGGQDFALISTGAIVPGAPSQFIVFENDNDASGNVFSIGYPAPPDGVIRSPTTDGDTPILTTGFLQPEKLSISTKYSETMYVADVWEVPGLGGAKGQSGSGFWLDSDPDGDGSQDRFLAGILVDGSGSNGSGWSETTYFAPLSGIYWALAAELRAHHNADEFPTHTLVSKQTGNGNLAGTFLNERIFGGAFDDSLHGWEGRDFLAGSAGRDQLAGGSESDVFYFQNDDYPPFTSVNPDLITDFNQGNSGVFSASEGDLIDLSGFQFATSTGFGTTSTVQLRSIEASGGLPAGAILEVNAGDGIWRAIARLDNVTSGQSVLIALTDAQSAARIGAEFVVDEVGDGTTWSISPGSQNVAEDDVTITFAIDRTGGNFEAETVYVSTVQIHGSYNDGDYVGRANVAVPFAAGATTETFTVQINADAFTEAEETFGLIVQADLNDPISTSLASSTFTIEDGSAPSVSGDTYIGDGLANTWSGTSSADLAFGDGGGDTLDGRGGNDIIFGGAGSDSIEGGAGSDIIVLGEGVDYADAGAGNDYIDARQSSAQNETIIAGAGDDTIIASGISSSSDRILTVEGGSGEDTLIVEATPNGSFRQGIVTHQFGADGELLTHSSAFEAIEAAIATGGPHYVSTSQFSSGGGRAGAWILADDIERFEYRGRGNGDLFLDWDGTSNTFLGGGGTDALYADWSDATTDIVWNLTVDNDTRKTLSNGVDVQSIERVLLETGSGDDNLVLGNQNDHVETGAGSDIIVLGEGVDYADAGAGNDYVRGGSRDDTYFVAAGDGLDVIEDNVGAGIDRILLGPGISIDDLHFEKSNGGVTLVIQFGTNEIHLGNHFNPVTGAQQNSVEKIEAQDGEILLSSIEWSQLTMSPKVLGTPEDDYLSGNESANETFSASAGNDLVDLGLGDDTGDGGAGIDTLSFASLDAPGFVFGDIEVGVIVDLSAQGTPQQTGQGNDIFTNFENLGGSGFADFLTGDGAANAINGGAGGDVLVGGDGDDTLEGGEGFDAVEGG
ncbi:MAG: peptidoglycan DD-metalloendopeptidase family protein, partial [Paracoccaceae bacterium]